MLMSTISTASTSTAAEITKSDADHAQIMTASTISTSHKVIVAIIPGVANNGLQLALHEVNRLRVVLKEGRVAVGTTKEVSEVGELDLIRKRQLKICGIVGGWGSSMVNDLANDRGVIVAVVVVVVVWLLGR